MTFSIGSTRTPPVGKSGARHQFDQLHGTRLGVFDEMQQCVAKFAGIVRRNVRRHADGDSAGAVGQQIRKCRRQDDRLALLAVISIPKVDRVFVDSIEQRLSDSSETRFGVTHRRGVVAVDVAEVPLAIDERVARGE